MYLRLSATAALAITLTASAGAAPPTPGTLRAPTAAPAAALPQPAKLPAIPEMADATVRVFGQGKVLGTGSCAAAGKSECTTKPKPAAAETPPAVAKTAKPNDKGIHCDARITVPGGVIMPYLTK